MSYYTLSEFIDLLIDVAEYYHEDEGEPIEDDTHDDPFTFTFTKLDITVMCARTVDALGGSDCKWCGADTLEAGELYMVTDAIWEAYGPPTNGVLCIGCLEDRMGRQLQHDDFKDVPLNTDDRPRSDRLRDRLAR